MGTQTDVKPKNMDKVKAAILTLAPYLNMAIIERRADLPSGTLSRVANGKAATVKAESWDLLSKQAISLVKALNDLV